LHGADHPRIPNFFFCFDIVMDPAGKEITMDVAIKMMNDQAHYEVKRNVCLAVLLYFGTLSPRLS
jgi:hypothetical protein